MNVKAKKGYSRNMSVVIVEPIVKVDIRIVVMPVEIGATQHVALLLNVHCCFSHILRKACVTAVFYDSV
ncbi:hypothetical protein GF323_02645 [Candidatus Woesearchaeota archaeon]|nr:hypothetical protein [Candidatus Woesearchaeota archaeon]